MKYHINGNGEAKPCHAKVKCRFGGRTGKQFHFDSKEEAEKFAEERLSKQYGRLGSAHRARGKAVDLTALQLRGIKVEHVNSIRDADFGNPDPDVSTVDLLEETVDQDFLAKIYSGETSGRPF